jgi:surface carbohydrate biosynthesis protein (TIGR04326 family)
LKIIIRPHPASDFSSEKYLKWQESVDRTDLSLLLERIDLIFCSNASSIAVDGYLAGKTILTMLNGETFNFSPMRGLNCDINITSPEELRASLSASALHNTNKKNKYFCLSKELQKWKTLFLRHSLLA